MAHKILTGDALTHLRTLKDQTIHTCVTSPPYFGLRDYGTAAWQGGDPACPHRPDATPSFRGIASSTLGGGKNHTGHKQEGFAQQCPRCGATRIDSQIGLEASPQAFVDKLVEVFREVRRVLRDDGTLWLNLGDSYASAWACNRRNVVGSGSMENGKRADRPNRLVDGLKEKDLMGIPWRVAFALQQDGWYLRQDIIWHKPNPMPESVRDRCTKAHEYIFLLSKSPTYYFDNEAIKEPAAYSGLNKQDASGFKNATDFNGKHAKHDIRNESRKGRASGNKTHKYVTEYEASATEEHRTKAGLMNVAGTAYATRNKRDVWTVSAKPFPEAHFATFPPDLIRPCVLAGCPPNGVVLDPFAGAATTGVVALEHSRHFIGIELNPEYVEMAERRLLGTIPLPPRSPPIHQQETLT